MKTLLGEWTDFRNRMVSGDAGREAVKDMRVAFYSGVRLLADAYGKLLVSGTASETDIAAFEGWDEELNEFFSRADFSTDESGAPWTRDDDAVYCVLLLMGGYDIPRTVIRAISDEECRLAQEWAIAVHLRASDNGDVIVPPAPEWVKQFEVTG